MKIVLAVSLLVAGCLANTIAPGSGGYGNSGVGQFAESELAMAAEFTDSISNENNFAQVRVDNLKAEQTILLKKLDENIQNTIPAFFDTQKTQDDRLDNVKQKINRVLHTLGPLETQLDGEKAMAELIDSQVTAFWGRFDSEIDEFNRRQNSSLQGIESFLFEAKQKLHTILLDSKSSAEDKVNELTNNALATVDFINTRHCFTTVVHVEVDEQTAEGMEDAAIDPSDLFDGAIPTAFCALQGFHTKLNLGQSHSYGPFGGYPDRRQNMALAVDCKPAADHVTVKVFDESSGEINRVTGAYVLVKMCTFGPQAFAPSHY